MTRIAKYIWLLPFAWLASPAFAEPTLTLDLKPFVGPSASEKLGGWLPPHGRQVLDGIPFEISGSVLVKGKKALQLKLPAAPHASGNGTGLRFERIHLLAAADGDGEDATTLAKVRLGYADGAETVLPVRFGGDVGNKSAPWHKAVTNTGPREVWRAQNSGVAQSDRYLRLFHVALTNPSPEKEVRLLALEPIGANPRLMVLGASVGPAAAEVLPDTLTLPKSPFPDLRPRTGELASAEGIVKSLAGQPLAGARIRVMAAREFNTQDEESSTDDAAVDTTATTDKDGHFVLPALPDNRLYRLGVTADDFEFTEYCGVDPKSDPVEIRLKPVPAASKTGKFAVHGKVVGPDGQALAFARVEPDGIGTSGSTGWGGNNSFPSEILTDTNGEFTFARNEKFDRLQVRIKAPGLARLLIWLPVTNGLQTVKMGVGAELRGRVLKEGQPLAGLRMGISGQDRDSQVYAGNFETKTGTNGTFVFKHLPPDTAWLIYGIMSSFKSHGALPPRLERSGTNGESQDLGDLQVVPGLHIAGQVKTRHGEPLPNNFKINVDYDSAWDSQSVEADADGKFRLDGLAKRKVCLWLNRNGWRPSSRNRNLDMWNPGRLVGILEGDKDDLLIEIEKGDTGYNYVSSNGQLPPQDQPQSRPLFGAEPSGPPFVTLAGQVVDDKTGKPILKYKVTPGRKPPIVTRPTSQKPMLQHLLEPFSRKAVPWNERIYWAYYQAENVINGTFAVDFMVLTSQPVLQIEADGYQPLETEALSVTDTNLILRLQAGAGPSGVVLLPNGQPAGGATIIYGAMGEQFSMKDSSLTAYGNKSGMVTTAADGKFSFEAKPRGVVLFVAHPGGWAQESVEKNGGQNVKIQLNPWATVTGILVNSNNVPLVGTNLHLTMFHDWQRGGALVNLQQESITDARGHFAFSNVPPSRVELQRIPPFPSGGGYTYQLQTWLVAEPGIVNDLGKVVVDRPPPDSMIDQIKQRLGL